MQILILILVILCFFCLYRAWRGLTIPDRMVAIDIMAILVVGICALLAVYTKRKFLIDVALAWIFLGFVGTLALAKYLSGRKFNE
ncbi:MAG: monovalent cation/H+ antiporter complex subunit F [bacterium]